MLSTPSLMQQTFMRVFSTPIFPFPTRTYEGLFAFLLGDRDAVFKESKKGVSTEIHEP